MSTASPFAGDPRDRDPEVRKEHFKRLVNGVNATGIALLVGSLVAPFIDLTRPFSLPRKVAGVVAGALLILFALFLLRYMKPKD